MTKKGVFRKHRLALMSSTLAVFGLFIYTINTNPSPFSSATTTTTTTMGRIGVWIALAVVGFWAIRIFMWIVSALWGGFHTVTANVDVALKQIPSPQQIASQLEQEWGRPATVLEIAAVHQMLTSEHNQAVLNAGIGLGALYLVGHKGKL
jgi:hypothetical protein